MDSDPPSVLITGGAGFIGSHLTERLLGQGMRVTVIDDCSTGTFENLAAAPNLHNLTQVPCQVSDCADLPVLTAQADYIFHLAAAVGVELVVHSPIRTIETNLDETEMLLQAAATSNTPILIASTSEVYGKSTRPAFAETDDLLIGPPYLGRWSYACSKLMDEFLAMAYFQERGLPITIARLFNTVGPRQTGRYGMVLPRFVEAALRNEPLKVHGTGKQTRCFCHVNDTVEALVRLKDTPSASGEIFNIGSTHEISIEELARTVIQQLNSRSEIQFIPYSDAYTPGFEDMMRRVPVVDKLEKVTGFRSSTPLSRIIESIADSMRRPV